MNKIKTIIVDDEKKARDLLEDLLKKHPEIDVVAKADSVDEAYRQILEHNPGLIFLDIQMPGKNGFELVRELNKNNINVPVIFVTAHNEFAIEAIKHAAFGYLMKPVGQEELKDTLQRFKTYNSKNDISKNMELLLNKLDTDNKIKFNIKTGFILIEPTNITHCIADGNYTNVHTKEPTRELVTINIGQVEKILPAKNFFRISRSVIINLKYLSRIDRTNRQCFIKTATGPEQFSIPIKQIRKLETLI